jgi:hypothetical protein
MIRALAILALLLAVCSTAEATPVIAAGREKEVMALFAPHTLGHEVVAGWKLMNVRVQPDNIAVELAGPGGAFASFRLLHPDAAPSDAVRTPSFAVVRETPAAADQAIAPLVVALRKNDKGGFWREAPTVTAERSQPESDDRSGGLWFTVLITVLGLGAVYLIARRRGA